MTCVCVSLYVHEREWGEDFSLAPADILGALYSGSDTRSSPMCIFSRHDVPVGNK